MSTGIKIRIANCAVIVILAGNLAWGRLEPPEASHVFAALWGLVAVLYVVLGILAIVEARREP